MWVEREEEKEAKKGEHGGHQHTTSRKKMVEHQRRCERLPFFNPINLQKDDVAGPAKIMTGPSVLVHQKGPRAYKRRETPPKGDKEPS